MRKIAWWGVVTSMVFSTVTAAAAGQAFPWQSRPGETQGKTPPVVKFLGPEQVSVTARQPQEVVLQFRVAEGYHINSHTPRERSLIPTQLMVADESGVETKAVDFPVGANYKPSFAPEEALSVYTGDFVLRAHITAQPGSHLLQGALRYQACDANACMPPKTIPVAVSLLAK